MKYVTIKDDQSGYRRLTGELNKLRGAELVVGVISDEKHSADSEITLKELAAVHEYGVTIKVTEAMRGFFAAIGYPLSGATTTIEIPERAFIRRTADKKKAQIRKDGRRLLNQLIQGRISAQQLLDKLGNLLVSMVQETIAEVDSPPLSQMTKDLRSGASGGESPLQDTGRLWQSIDYEIRWS